MLAKGSWQLKRYYRMRENTGSSDSFLESLQEKVATCSGSLRYLEANYHCQLQVHISIRRPPPTSHPPKTQKSTPQIARSCQIPSPTVLFRGSRVLGCQHLHRSCPNPVSGPVCFCIWANWNTTHGYCPPKKTFRSIISCEILPKFPKPWSGWAWTRHSPSSRSNNTLVSVETIGKAMVILGYPLVNIQKTMNNHMLFMGKSTISMAIFNSYNARPPR